MIISFRLITSKFPISHFVNWSVMNWCNVSLEGSTGRRRRCAPSATLSARSDCSATWNRAAPTTAHWRARRSRNASTLRKVPRGRRGSSTGSHFPLYLHSLPASDGLAVPSHLGSSNQQLQLQLQQHRQQHSFIISFRLLLPLPPHLTLGVFHWSFIDYLKMFFFLYQTIAR